MVAGLRRSLRHTHTLGTLRTRTSHALFTMFSSRALLLLQGSGSFRAGRTMRKTAMGSVCCHHHRRRAFCSHNNSSSNNGEDLREFIATLGVYFTLPEQGVTSPEILTRCDHPSNRGNIELCMRFASTRCTAAPERFGTERGATDSVRAGSFVGLSPLSVEPFSCSWVRYHTTEDSRLCMRYSGCGICRMCVV